MANFKNTIWKLSLLFIILTGCDPVYELRTEPLAWQIENPPVEVLRISGPSSAFPTLDSISISRNGALNPLKLFLMTNITLPDSAVLAQLYALPLDSLIGKDYIFDTPENGFYNLCLIEFAAGQTRASCSVRRPITHEFVYVFGLSNQPPAEIAAALHFHRLGSKEVPEVEVISLE